MIRSTLLATIVAGALVAGVAVAAELKSGPQVGGSVSAFHPLNVTGSAAGEKACLVWKNGGNPVAMIFARDVDANLTSLVKQIDAETAKNSGKKMGSFVVFCSDDKDLEEKLKKLAKDEKIAKTVLAIDNPAGPKGYNVAKDADVTVVFYKGKKVVANHAFKKGDLKDDDVKKVMADLPKIFE